MGSCPRDKLIVWLQQRSAADWWVVLAESGFEHRLKNVPYGQISAEIYRICSLEVTMVDKIVSNYKCVSCQFLCIAKSFQKSEFLLWFHTQSHSYCRVFVCSMI